MSYDIMSFHFVLYAVLQFYCFDFLCIEDKASPIASKHLYAIIHFVCDDLFTQLLCVHEYYFSIAYRFYHYKLYSLISNLISLQKQFQNHYKSLKLV